LSAISYKVTTGTKSGTIRFMTDVEAVTGLTFISWSASFTFLEMLKTWNTSD